MLLTLLFISIFLKFKNRYFFYVILIVLTLFSIPPKWSNTCRSYAAYLNIFFSSECYYDPDLNDDMFGIIRRHIGVSEIHQVESQDGFLLDVTRIPRKNPRGVILFLHPMLTDGTIWVAQQNDSVAFLFWRAGYDVWLGNLRGTFYSKHKILKENDPRYWKFSFHEMGYYDVHATTQYITRVTNNSKVILLGYSMGASASLVYGMTRPEVATSNLKLIVAIAPAIYISHSTNVASIVIPFMTKLWRKFQLSDTIPFVRVNYCLSKIMQTAYDLFPFKKVVAYFLTLVADAGSPNEIDPNLIKLLIQNVISKTAVIALDHYVQFFETVNKSVRFYDYGKNENLKVYGSSQPPLYVLQNINVPVFMVHGQNDSYVCVKDAEMLWKDIPEACKIYGKMMVEGFNHFDILFGKHRNEKIFDKIIAVLNYIS